MSEMQPASAEEPTTRRPGWIMIPLILLGVIWLIPLLWTLLAAFVPTRYLIGSSPVTWPAHITLSAFTDAWQVAPFPRYYLNTVIFVFGLLFVQLITISLAGFALARLEFWGKSAVFLLFLTQLMVPATVLILPNYQTITRFGWQDTHLALMAPYFASAFGAFLMRQAFKQVPRELEEASRVDGANALQILWHVFLPVTRSSLAAFSIVSVTYHWNEFLWPLLITSTVASRPLTVGLALLTQMGETGAQWGLIAAGTLIVVTPVLIFVGTLQRQFTKSFLSSGIR
jgi:sn-glycerol 3-phosphate transport system permease protein